MSRHLKRNGNTTVISWCVPTGLTNSEFVPAASDVLNIYLLNLIIYSILGSMCGEHIGCVLIIKSCLTGQQNWQGLNNEYHLSQSVTTLPSLASLFPSLLPLIGLSLPLHLIGLSVPH